MWLSTPLIEYRIEYNKKPGKPSVVKVVKDTAVARDDIYKSGTIHTGPGESPNSISRPTPKGKPKAGKPITQGKLLRPGGPGGGPSKLASRPAASRPVPQPMPSQPSQPRQTSSRPVPQPAASQSRPVPQPLAAINGINHNRTDSASSINRAPPPPPPVAPPAAKKDTYKALYAFAGQSEIELSLEKDEIVEVLRKEGNGTFTPMLQYAIGTADRLCLRLVARKETGWYCSSLGTFSLSSGRSTQAYTASRPSRPNRPCCTPSASRGHNQRRQWHSPCSRKSETHTSCPAKTSWRW